MSTRNCLASVLACVVAVGAALAAPPPLINYQGVLRDASGDPRNGSFNMVFKFFDASLAGSEMLVDSHTGAQSVTVTGGLFNAQLGGGLVAPGGGATSFGSLDAMFSATDQVWLEIVINGETLSPRVRVISAAYALNAGAVDGVDSGSFLRSDASDHYTSGTLTTDPGTVLDVNGDIWLNGILMMDPDGPDGAQAIYFYNSGNPTGASVQWDDGNNRFYVTNGLLVDGALRSTGFASIGGSQVVIGANGPDQDQLLAFYEDGAPQGEYLLWDDSDDLFHLSDDFRVNGDVFVNGDALSMGGLGIEATQRMNFFNAGSPTAESLSWDDPQDRFELTDEVAMVGPLRVGSTVSASVAYNTVGAGTPQSGDMLSTSDLFVADDLEVGSRIYLGDISIENASSLRVNANLTTAGSFYAEGKRLHLDINGPNFGYLEYDSAFQQFKFTEDLDINGEMSADVKNFVQNHPLDPSLSIVYTTLEGPEASAFTRGSARLDGGVARVRLDETFAWVANPDLGLTVTLTPRGGWSELYVESITPAELVVRAAPGTAADAAFDYLVLGLRIGYEESPVVRPRRREATLPTLDSLHAKSQGRPELARTAPLTRYQEMARAVTGHEVADFTAAEALRQKVGIGKPEHRNPGPTALEGASSSEPSRRSVTPKAPSPDLQDEKAQIASAQADALALDTLSSRGPTGSAAEARSPSRGEVVAGDVLVLDPSGLVHRADAAGDSTVVGIAAAEPAVSGDGSPAVSFATGGIAICRVDAAYGVIRPGDLLVSSPTPGHAMRSDAPRPGTIVGKAMEAVETGTAAVRVLVTLR